MMGLESMGFSRDSVLTHLRNFASQFFVSYARANGKPRWADKTPFYIDCLNFIDELYQHRASYVMLYRHGLDVAYSLAKHMDGFLDEMPNYSSVQERREVPRVTAAYWHQQVKKMRTFQVA